MQPLSSSPQVSTALEGSLKRLRTDYIDLYQIHWPDRIVNIFGQQEFKPPENAEIENKTSPKTWTYENIETMKNQLKQKGLSIDWSREIATCDKLYYQNQQKLIIEFYRKNIIYKKISDIMKIFSSSINGITMVLLIIAGAGALKQILIDSGVSDYVAELLQKVSLSPLILGWLIASIVRVSIGSATVAGLTTAGIVLPIVEITGVNPELMVLAVGSGSLMLSHVNDPGFWMFKEYFNLSIKDTLLTWTIMETSVGISGLIGVLLLNLII